MIDEGAPVTRFAARAAEARDAEAVARIYSEGIEDRVATFETRPRGAADMLAWIDDGVPLLVVERGGDVVAWAAAHPYRPGREAYAGVGECSAYVARAVPGGGREPAPRPTGRRMARHRDR